MKKESGAEHRDILIHPYSETNSLIPFSSRAIILFLYSAPMAALKFFLLILNALYISSGELLSVKGKNSLFFSSAEMIFSA